MALHYPDASFVELGVQPQAPGGALGNDESIAGLPRTQHFGALTDALAQRPDSQPSALAMVTSLPDLDRHWTKAIQMLYSAHS